MAPNARDHESPSPTVVTELEFESRDQACFPVALSSVGAGRVRLARQITLDDDTGVEFYAAADSTTSAVAGRAAETGQADAVSVVGAAGSTVVFRLTTTAKRVVPAIERAGAVVTSAAAEGGVGRLVAMVPADVDPGDVTVAALGQGYAVDLVARRQRAPSDWPFDADAARASLRGRLTPRQREVLLTAYEHGYFERPRRRTGEELAVELGISSATFSQHLRAAQRAVLGVLLEDGRGDALR